MINFFRKRNVEDAVMGVLILTLFVGGIYAAPVFAQAIDGGSHVTVLAPTPVPVMPTVSPVAASGGMWDYLMSHKDMILGIFIAWVLIASVINSRWPKPASPPWKVTIHLILIDLPAFLASKDMQGVLGKLNIPFFTISDPHPATPTFTVDAPEKPPEVLK